MSNGTLARRETQSGGLAALIEGAAPRFAAALPAYFSAEKMVQVVSIIANRTPKLQQCEPESLVTAIITAGSLGIDLTPALGEGYLIPRENWKTKAVECTFMIGYQGLAKLAHQTGTVVFIQAREVCEGDEFEVLYNPDLTYRHKPAFGRDRGAVTHVYAVAKLTSGDHVVEVLTAEELESIHQRSEGYQAAVRWKKEESGPWVSDRLEMEKKTAVRRLCKRLPRATTPAAVRAFGNLAAAIEHDNSHFVSPERAALEPPAPPKNDSGYGRGQYASPEQTEKYLGDLKATLGQWNAWWADRWDGRATLEELGTLRDAVNVHQADGHLLKWAVETGRLDASIVPEEAKTRQLGRYTAIVYCRGGGDAAAMGEEIDRYVKEQCERKTVAVYKKLPHLIEPEDENQDPGDDVDLPPGL